jgi:putative two-component system response regulator
MKNTRPIIFLIDDDSTNLKMGKNALLDAYDVFTAPSAERLFSLLEKYTPNMLLLDIDMPEMSGFEAMKILQSQKKWKDIPVIFLTGMNSTDDELQGLSMGAVDYISKPWNPALLRKRVEVHLRVAAQNEALEEQRRKLEAFNENLTKLVDERASTILELQTAIIKTMAELVEYRDDITGKHIEHTMVGMKILLDATWKAGYAREEMAAWNPDLIVQSSQLHDVGKIAIRDSILRKEGRLTPAEFEEMKKHTTFGVAIIENIEKTTRANEFLNYAKIFAGCHHERWDGGGYPQGLRGVDIPLLARILSVVDTYDAITSERSYKPARPHSEAVAIIREGRCAQFDPSIADIFLSIEGQFQAVFAT